jgi:hypothetical protein
MPEQRPVGPWNLVEKLRAHCKRFRAKDCRHELPNVRLRQACKPQDKFEAGFEPHKHLSSAAPRLVLESSRSPVEVHQLRRTTGHSRR